MSALLTLGQSISSRYWQKIQFEIDLDLWLQSQGQESESMDVDLDIPILKRTNEGYAELQ